MTPAEVIACTPHIAPHAADRLARFVAALLDENTRLNLTASRTPQALWRHVADSLALLQFVPPAGLGRVIDVGTGGGLPGVVIACAAPSARVMLVDATQKKVRAVERIVQQVGLANVELRWGRVEDLGADVSMRASFNTVCARAVADVATLVGYAGPLMARDATAWFYKSQRQADGEIAAATRAAAAAGLRHAATHAYVLPGEDAERVLVAYVRR